MRKPLRIAMVSRADQSSSGAGAVADFLSATLRSRGHVVDRFVRHPAKGNSLDVRPLWRLPGDAFLRNILAWDFSGLHLTRAVGRGDYDIVHLHDPSVAFGVSAVRHVAGQAPVVVTLHDDSGLTGGCLFAEGCLRYQRECGCCPQLGRWPLVIPFDTTRSTHHATQRLAATRGVAAVAPSALFAARATQGAWRGQPVTVIHNPVDDSTFTSVLRQPGRDRLGLPPDKLAILMVAANLDLPEKGLPDLSQAFARLATENPSWRLVLAGRLTRLPQTLAPFANRVSAVGVVRDRSALAEMYAAADVLAVPSRGRDQTPCTIAESLACGTPVVAYNAAAIPEMLGQNNGKLVASGDSAALAQAIRQTVNDMDPTERESNRQFAIEKFGGAKATDRYEEVYHATIGQWRQARPLRN